MYATTTELRKRVRVRAIADQLYRTRNRQLLSIARSSSSTQTDAEEALQEAFASFISHFDPDRGAPAIAWLILTLKRACWDKACRGRREVSLDEPASPDELNGGSRLDVFASETDMAERVVDVCTTRDAIARLKTDEQRALLLLGMGYSYAEICQLTGWTYTKVNRCISEGRGTLRKDGS
jgi:RNA polymerase sigma factor (sigma-70 family)